MHTSARRRNVGFTFRSTGPNPTASQQLRAWRTPPRLGPAGAYGGRRGGAREGNEPPPLPGPLLDNRYRDVGRHALLANSIRLKTAKIGGANCDEVERLGERGFTVRQSEYTAQRKMPP
jgi:hypothetical protein